MTTAAEPAPRRIRRVSRRGNLDKAVAMIVRAKIKKASDLSIVAVAEALGMRRATLSVRVLGHQPFTPSLLGDVAEILGTTPTQIMAQAERLLATAAETGGRLNGPRSAQPAERARTTTTQVVQVEAGWRSSASQDPDRRHGAPPPGEREDGCERAVERALDDEVEHAWHRGLDARRVTAGRDCGALLPTQRRVMDDGA